MTCCAPQLLEWIGQQRQRMCRLVLDWANINSGSHNLPGLAQLATRLEADFAFLGGQARRVELPPQRVIDSLGQTVERPLGQALVIRKRAEALRQVLLCIHMDTVYGEHHPFQRAWLEGDRMYGPGVADAKGGLAVLLVAAKALERSDLAHRIGWQIVLNPDEELGSPGSRSLLAEAAARADIGLLFEPALPDGALVCERKGSGNFTAVIRGRSAHAGRNFADGRNAIHAMARLIVRLEELGRELPGVTINVGKVEGGGPVNVVPDLAIARLNVRVSSPAQQAAVEGGVRAAAEEIARIDGISIDLHGGFTAPPKPLDEATRLMLEQLAACGRELGIPIAWRPSGGVSDGNRLAAAGLPTIDSLGVVGGQLHSDGEYMLPHSLTQRAALTALFLAKLAAGELPWPERRRP